MGTGSRFRSGAAIWLMLPLLVLGPLQAQGNPGILFQPESLDFQGVAQGDSAEAGLQIHNPGAESLVISALELAAGSESVFSVADTSFTLAPGDSVDLLVSFAPIATGILTDALLFETNLELEDPSSPRPLVSIQGTGLGPDIEVIPLRLTFVSSQVGAADTQKVEIANVGSDTLRVSSLTLSGTRFQVSSDSLSLGPSETLELDLIYTPEGTDARTDTLKVESNDFESGLVSVVLEALETPNQIGAAGLSLVLLDSLAFPNAGGTVSVRLDLNPNGDTIDGVEVYFGYDDLVFAPSVPDSPMVRTGFTDNAIIVVNRILDGTNPGSGIVHFSVLFQGSVTAEGALAQLDFSILQPLSTNTLLRALNEVPLHNSQYITSTLATLTLARGNAIGLGNTPPKIKPFPILKTDEDLSAAVGLRPQATDLESAVDALIWAFQDPDSLVQVTVTPLVSTTGAVVILTPPAGGSGVYRIDATVTDPGGASDSAVVVLEVRPVNDPPSVPVYAGPADSVVVSTPLTFTWSGSDPDLNDTLTFEFRFGASPTTLQVNTQGLTVGQHTLPGLPHDETFYWQIVSQDLAGARTSGPTRRFTTAPDVTSPEIVTNPSVSNITATSASIGWTTSEDTDSHVRLGLLADLSDSAAFGEATLFGSKKIHSITQVGLAPETLYFYRVAFADAAGNLGNSDIQSFMTTELADDPGDLNGDRKVDFLDFVGFTSAFESRVGETPYDEKSDLDEDEEIGFLDFLAFAKLFGTDYTVTKMADQRDR